MTVLGGDFNWGDITLTACSNRGSFAMPHFQAIANHNPYTSKMPTELTSFSLCVIERDMAVEDPQLSL